MLVFAGKCFEQEFYPIRWTYVNVVITAAITLMAMGNVSFQSDREVMATAARDGAMNFG
jgi:hypothetical protein